MSSRALQYGNELMQMFGYWKIPASRRRSIPSAHDQLSMCPNARAMKLYRVAVDDADAPYQVTSRARLPKRQERKSRRVGRSSLTVLSMCRGTFAFARPHQLSSRRRERRAWQERRAKGARTHAPGILGLEH